MWERDYLSARLIQFEAGHNHSGCQSAAAMWNQSPTNQLQAFSKHNTTHHHQLHPVCLSLSHIGIVLIVFAPSCLKKASLMSEKKSKKQRPDKDTVYYFNFICVYHFSFLVLWHTSSSPHLAPVWHQTQIKRPCRWALQVLPHTRSQITNVLPHLAYCLILFFRLSFYI